MITTAAYIIMLGCASCEIDITTSNLEAEEYCEIDVKKLYLNNGYLARKLYTLGYMCHEMKTKPNATPQAESKQVNRSKARNAK